MKETDKRMEWLNDQAYTHYEQDSHDGDDFFDVIVVKVSDLKKAFNVYDPK